MAPLGGAVTICVGDLHGHPVQARALWARLAGRVGAAAFEAATVVFLGDYNDRGPDTRGVIDWLLSLRAAHPRQKHVFLAGNHDFSFAAFVGALPPAPEGFRAADTWRGYESEALREGWWSGPGYEEMHLQGRRWGGTIRDKVSPKGHPYKGSTYDAAPTFESYGIAHGDRDGLVAALPDSHKEFLRNLLWVYEQEEEEEQGEGESAYTKLIAVHAGLEMDKPVEGQLALLRARDVSTPRVEALSGRKNVWDTPLELAQQKVLLVSGHHGALLTEPRRLIIDEFGGVDGKPIAAMVLPSREVVRDVDPLEEGIRSDPLPLIARAMAAAAPAGLGR